MNNTNFPDNKRFNSYSVHLKNLFGERVQKISVDAGFTCPNRDNTKSTDGCIYCNNRAFTPFYTSSEKSIETQLKEGIGFFSKKYSSMKYLAYFQPYTNTYASIEVLRRLYYKALNFPRIIGLVISTRPDCINEDIIKLIKEISANHYTVVEYGIESANDTTLGRINRCHKYEETVKAIEMTHNAGISTCGHLIIGLPGETKVDFVKTASEISKLPLKSLKLHQLQIIKGTKLAEEYEKNESIVKVFEVDEYVDIMVDFLEVLNPAVMIERFTSESPPEMLIAPQWGGLKNYEITHMIEKRLEERDTWQGKLFDF